MKIGCRLLFSVVWVMAAFIGCQQQANNGKLPESKEAKQLLQGVWSDVESESVVFQIHGDSVYYPDSTSMPAYFRVYNDTLYIGSSSRYHIEKHSEHVLWFKGGDGEIVKLVKENDTQEEELFEKQKTQILTLSDVMKNDTVVAYQNNRYHLYIAVNPTKYKVTRQTINDDGLDVENVYYDNIIHLSIFQGARQLFSRDFRKQQYQKRLPSRFFDQAILNNMEFSSIDDKGVHMNVSVCTPGDACCYLIEHVISFDGKLSTETLEY
jgi:hypothetical protein